MARRRQRTFVRPAAKSKVWLGVNLDALTVAASSLNLLSSLNATALALRPFTVLRSHLTILYTTDQSSAAETPFGALGMIVASDKAVATGITAVPTPITQSDGDFFVWQGLQEKYEFITGVGFQNVGTHYSVDSKAMRKVQIDENVAIVQEQTSAVGAIIIIHGRFLVQLT